LDHFFQVGNGGSSQKDTLELIARRLDPPQLDPGFFFALKRVYM
jgi:hypothetical protein